VNERTQRRTPQPAKPPITKKRAPKPALRKPAQPLTRDEAVKRMISSGRELTLRAHRLGFDGSFDDEYVDTELRFVEPMSGLGLIDAYARNRKIELVWYEASNGKVWRPPPGFQGKRPTSFGRFGFGRLDEELHFDPDSRKAWGESPLEIGFLGEHVEPRVVALDGGAVLLGQRSFRGKCDATVIAPFVMPMIQEPIACALEPRRFLDEARARHAGKKVELPAPPAIDAASARRTPWQPSWDVGRVVVSGSRAFTLVGGELHSWTYGGVPQREAAVLEAERVRIRWGTIDTGGQALASIDGQLVAVSPDGTTQKLGPDARFLTGPERDDASRALGHVGALVGGRWWLGRGELRPADAPTQGAPAEPGSARAVDMVALAGGRTHGLRISIESGVLRVSALAPDGAATLLGARAPSPIGPDFELVRGPAGGALLVGRVPNQQRQLVTLHVDDAGRVSEPSQVHGFAPPLGRLRLAPTPGGAIAFDRQFEYATWIDAQGAVLGGAPFPPGRSEARCLDGEPAPRWAPSPEPGRFVEYAELAAPGTCAVGAFAWGDDGTLRWFLSRTRGASAIAELWIAPRSVMPSAPAISSAPAPQAPKTASPNPGAPPCPADMVSIAGRYCVDRYEGTLADRRTGWLLAPDYPPTPNALAGVLADWSTRRERGGDLHARAMPLPALGDWQVGAALQPVALSRGGVRPSSYVSGTVAREACKAAGKRLCSHDEWRTACRGEAQTRHPYGDQFVMSACNVNRPLHPAAALHGHASLGHLDPRLVRVEEAGLPVLHETGTHQCVSRWGDDGVHDMVGNLDEWVDHKGGAFAGGFFARGTTNGCDALVDAHPEPYLDYTTGLRCCRDADPSGPPR
jgi:hypothetical protein